MQKAKDVKKHVYPEFCCCFSDCIFSFIFIKNLYNAGKTIALLSGDASWANRCYVVATVGGGGL